MNDFDISSNGGSSLPRNSQEVVPISAFNRTDLVSKSLPNSSNPSMLPDLEKDILRYEIEELDLRNYLVESNNVSSGGKHISLAFSDSLTGKATGFFNGEEGNYQVSVGFYDENDGVSSSQITVAGNTQNFKFDQDLAADAPTSDTLTERVTHSAIKLEKGDAFTIEGKFDYAEYARFDYIEFTRVDSDLGAKNGKGKESSDSSITKSKDKASVILPASPSANDIDGETLKGNPSDSKSDIISDSKTYYVSPNGNNDNPGTKEKPWKTINHAVSEDSAVTAGDTILVQPGKYTELINLKKSGNAKLGHITLKADGDVTLRDPSPKGGLWHEGVIQSAGEGYWKIDGFRIENTSFAGISLRDANNMIVKNNHTFETGGSGIIVMPDSYFQGGEREVTSKNIKVVDNTIERANWKWEGRGDTKGVQEALSIWGVDGFEVANNTLKEGNREGIDIKTGSRNGSVHNNTVSKMALISGTPKGYNGGPGIYVDGNRSDTFNIDIYNNVVHDNTSEGIAISDEIPSQGDVRNIRVYNNVIYDNGKKGVNSGSGLMVGSNVRDVEFSNNTVVGNVQSFVIDGSDYLKGRKIDGVTLRNNIFANPSYINGVIEDANNVALDNNLFTDETDELFKGGSGLRNFKETNNIQVKSVNFLDSKAKDYRLSSDSPAIDKASNISDYASTDKNRVKRDGDNAPDIGAYEKRTSD
ncbi:MAG: right-handed parallel beta-helix repeat-containing protein [Cyanobacteria bacterium P01_A01_bin.84]